MTFEEAVSRSKNLSERPSNENLLLLYALYKQAVEGNVQGDRPGGFDFKSIAKYDAWAAQKGKNRDLAAQEYVALVNKLANNE